MPVAAQPCPSPRVTGVPIKYMGVGERPDGLEVFHADRLASRILAMGDVLTLIERAQEAVDEQKAKEMERKIRQASFDLNDFLDQLQSVKKMGSLDQIMEMIPGMGSASRKMMAGDLDETKLRRIEAIIHSMTPDERQHPGIINGEPPPPYFKGQRHHPSGHQPTAEPVQSRPRSWSVRCPAPAIRRT